MSGTTPVEGYPYPLESDFADVQDAFRLAVSIDADLRAEQAPFRAFEGRPSFIGRQTANGSGSISGADTFKFDAVDWDNTGGAVVGAFSWTQPISQGPSWWLFGADILVAQISGTPVVGDLTMGDMSISTTDQVSGLSSSVDYYQRNDETNTGGEWINMFAMAPIYRGSVTQFLVLNGTSTKAIAATSRLWGMYLGPVV